MDNCLIVSAFFLSVNDIFGYKKELLPSTFQKTAVADPGRLQLAQVLKFDLNLV